MASQATRTAEQRHHVGLEKLAQQAEPLHRLARFSSTARRFAQGERAEEVPAFILVPKRSAGGGGGAAAEQELAL